MYEYVVEANVPALHSFPFAQTLQVAHSAVIT